MPMLWDLVPDLVGTIIANGALEMSNQCAVRIIAFAEYQISAPEGIWRDATYLRIRNKEMYYMVSDHGPRCADEPTI